MTRWLTVVWGCSLLSLAYNAQAASLSAQHQLTHALPSASGTEVTLNIEITNKSDTALNGITLSPAKSSLYSPVGVTTIQISSLAPGESDWVTLTLTTTQSPDYFHAQSSLSFDVQTEDTAGQRYNVNIDSTSK